MALIFILALYATVGVMSVIGSIYLSQRFIAPRYESLAFGLFLIVIACFYLVFLSHFADPEAWRLELTAIAAFVVLGLLGIRIPALLIVGYLLHGGWDFLHELEAHANMDPFGGRRASEIPLAYGVFCAAYDCGMAAYFFTRRSQWKSAWSAQTDSANPAAA